MAEIQTPSGDACVDLYIRRLRHMFESGSESEVAAMEIDGQTNKEHLTALFELLGLDTNCLNSIPHKGFAA